MTQKVLGTKRCKYCLDRAMFKLVWADGRAQILTCAAHKDRAFDVIEKREKDHVSKVVRL